MDAIRAAWASPRSASVSTLPNAIPPQTLHLVGLHISDLPRASLEEIYPLGVSTSSTPGASRLGAVKNATTVRSHPWMVSS